MLGISIEIENICNFFLSIFGNDVGGLNNLKYSQVTFYSPIIFFLLSFQDDGIEFFNTIVLQPHLKLVTDLGRGYHVRCRYKSREAVAKLTKSAESSPQAFRSEEVNDRGEYGRSLGSR